MKARLWLGLVLLLPGGLVILAGLALAWPGLALCLSGLRRMTAASGEAGRADEVTTPAPVQPYGEPHEPSPFGASIAEPPGWHLTSTGEPVGSLPWNRGFHPLLWTSTPIGGTWWPVSKEDN